MRICVDGGGYVAAATAFADANQLAALHHDTLACKLDGYAAMAGDDATASEFAQAYDDAAEAALGALVDLTASFASLSRLTTASLDNHGRAEAASVIAGATVYDGSALDDGTLVSVLPTTPPSSLGGDPPALSDKENWVLDHVESFTWPNADTDRLRDAAHTWRGAAEAVDRLTDHCIAASGGFHSERSPEIPLALDAVADVRSTIADLAAQLASLADACDEYAAHVDAQRAELKALLAEILQMVVEGVVISVAISIITGGAGTVIAAGAVVARVAAQSPRFAAIIRTLTGLTAATASKVRAARESLWLAQSRLARFLRPTAPSAFGPRTLGAAQRLRYEASPKHGLVARGRAAPRPAHGQEALDFSYPVNPRTTTRRIAADPDSGEYVVFDETMSGVFHGHVRTWDELTHAMQRALIEAGAVTRKGRILGGSE